MNESLSFQGAKHTHICGYEWGSSCRWQWGCGDGLHAESDWGVWRSAPLGAVCADIHSPAPIPRGPLSSLTLSGWLEYRIVAVMSLIQTCRYLLSRLRSVKARYACQEPSICVKARDACEAPSICVKARDACQAPSICVKARDACQAPSICVKVRDASQAPNITGEWPL